MSESDDLFLVESHNNYSDANSSAKGENERESVGVMDVSLLHDVSGNDTMRKGFSHTSEQSNRYDSFTDDTEMFLGENYFEVIKDKKSVNEVVVGDDSSLCLFINEEKSEDALRPSSPFVVLNYTNFGNDSTNDEAVKATMSALEMEREKVVKELKELRIVESERRSMLLNSLLLQDSEFKDGATELFLLSHEIQAEKEIEGDNFMLAEKARSSFLPKCLMKDDGGIYMDMKTVNVKEIEECSACAEQDDEWMLSDEKKNLNKYGSCEKIFKCDLGSEGLLDDNNAYALSLATEVEHEECLAFEKEEKSKIFDLLKGRNCNTLSRCYLLNLGKVLLNRNLGLEQTGECCGEAPNSDSVFSSTTANDKMSDNEKNALQKPTGTTFCYLGTMSTKDTGLLEFVFNKDDAVKRLAFRRRESELMLVEEHISFEIEVLRRCSNKAANNYWQSNESTTFCSRCAKEFSFTVRKHHCRRCGALLCNDCCSHVGRDMYAQQFERYNGRGIAKVGFCTDGGNDAPAVSANTTTVLLDNAWMFDTQNLSKGDTWRCADASFGVTAKQQLKCAVPVSSLFSSAANEANSKSDSGCEGLQVRSAPWCRICTGCYLICLRARLEKNYSDVLCDGRRRFHVLRGNEKSLKNINITWETRVAQMDILKHVVLEKSTDILQRQVRNIAEGFMGWLRTTGHCAKKKFSGLSRNSSSESLV